MNVERHVGLLSKHYKRMRIYCSYLTDEHCEKKLNFVPTINFDLSSKVSHLITVSVYSSIKATLQSTNEQVEMDGSWNDIYCPLIHVICWICRLISYYV